MRPSLSQIPKIIEFLGRDPFEKEAEKIGDKLRECRRVHGLSQKKLAALLGIDQTTLAGWEKGKHRPMKSLLDNILITSAVQLRKYEFFPSHTK